MVQLLADWQGPAPCCGPLTCWSGAESAWQYCLSYACTNKPEYVSDHLRADLRHTENDHLKHTENDHLRQTEKGMLRYAKWGLLTKGKFSQGALHT